VNGASVVSVMGGHKTTVSSWGSLVNLPAIQYGQNLDVVVKMNIPDSLPQGQAYLNASLVFSHWNFTQSVQILKKGVDRNGSAEVDVQRRRCMVVESIKKLNAATKINDTKEAQKIIADLVADLKEGKDPREQGLLADVTGQIQEAVSKEEYYKKWGMHYLPSLCRAHQLQQSNNFKDVGIQFYGGQLFQQLRDEIDDIFCKLPPPKRSAVPVTKSSSSSNTNYSPSFAGFTMATYHSSGAACFAGVSSVLMADGSSKCAKDIAKGDRVATLDNKQAKVVCVLKTHCRGNQMELVELDGGLIVTPYHPIRIDGKWCFPCDVKTPTMQQCPAVFSFVLEEETSHHVMIINGVECVTLGHNYVDDDVVRHPYFGSRKVVDDMRGMRGWDRGLVEVVSGCMIRDEETGLICGIRNDDVCATKAFEVDVNTNVREVCVHA